MKIKYRLLTLIATAGLITSCSRSSDSPATDPVTNTGTPDKINDFVWKGMNSWYYWQKNVPALADNAYPTTAAYAAFINGKTPDKLFYSLLYDYGKTDRFSWIVSDVNSLLAEFSGVSKSSGMDYNLYYKDSSKTTIVGIVNYVVPGSPAETSGIRRGDILIGVNGIDITNSNYTQLASDQFKVTVAQNVSLASGFTYNGTKEYSVTSTVLEENPVAFTKVIEAGTHKIGYLVYNGFRSNYNDELNAAFGAMKAAGVTDLVLDLRYNGGGSVETAVALGQMVTGQFTGSPYVIMDFNDKHNKYDSTDPFEAAVNIYDYANGTTTKTRTENANSLNLNKVYVLTSHGTASASELTINGLKAYINVVTIGDETYGKFVGSITLYDSPAQDFMSYDKRNTSHTWAMQPITFAYYNGKHENQPTGGIVPDYQISPFAYFGTMKNFGDTSDVALAKALQLITGSGKYITPEVRYNVPDAFVASRKTMTRFGTEVYLEHPELK